MSTPEIPGLQLTRASDVFGALAAAGVPEY
jgi:hypothetical protein